MFLVAIVLLGFHATVSQVLMLREFLVVFAGNEISVAIILFVWFVGVSAGATVASKWLRQRYPTETDRALGGFCTLQILMGICLPLQLVGIRLVRAVLNTGAGELVPFPQLVLCCGVLIVPQSFLIGLIFPLGCIVAAGVWSGRKGVFASHVGRVYALESLGSLAGGLIFSFVLVQRFSAFHIVGWLEVLIFANAALVMTMMARSGNRRRRASAFVYAGFAVALLAVALGLPGRANRRSVERRWASLGTGLRLVEWRDTRYQHLTLGEADEQYSLFGNGQPIVSFPDPFNPVQIAHLIASEHPSPRSAVLVGGSPEMVPEMLKHGIESLDYVELDPEVLRMVLAHLPEGYVPEDGRVQIHFADGRRFLKDTRRSYDIVAVLLPDPTTASLNRFYTEGFFRQVRDRLNPGGVLAMDMTSAANYLAGDIIFLSGSVYKTLRAVFDHVVVAPDGTNYLFASNEPGVVTTDQDILADRYENRAIKTEYFSKYQFELFFPRERVEYTQDFYESATGVPINTDLRPVTYFNSLIIWDRFSGGHLGSVLRSLRGANLGWFAAIATVFYVLVILPKLHFTGDRQRRARTVALLAIATTGFAGIAFDIVGLYVFQSVFGYLYQEVGAVVALFMAGLTAGSLLLSRRLETKAARWLVVLFAMEIVIGAFAFIFPFALRLSALAPVSEPLGKLVFFAVIAIAGMLIGAEFPLANKIYNDSGGSAVKGAALTDSADHFGACVGALITGVVLVPLVGLWAACALVGIVKLLSATLVGWQVLARGE